MGEIAEDMCDGTCCELCGCYFEGPDGHLYTHDYPVVCWDCWLDIPIDERKDFQRALVKTF